MSSSASSSEDEIDEIYVESSEEEDTEMDASQISESESSESVVAYEAPSESTNDGAAGPSTGTNISENSDPSVQTTFSSWSSVKKEVEKLEYRDAIEFFGRKYKELSNDNQKMVKNMNSLRKRCTIYAKREEALKKDNEKQKHGRLQLENVCRELHRYNKDIKEENLARIKEEEAKRREITNNFTERFNTLTVMITESKDQSEKFKEENQNMAEKLASLYDQYHQRENHLEALTKQLELHKQLSEAQAKKAEIEHQATQQVFLAEKRELEGRIKQHEREINLLLEKNQGYESEIELYKKQYAEFETTMTKSIKVFDTFKLEMSKMNKELRTLESERNDWKKRWQCCTNSLTSLSGQHLNLVNEQTVLEKKLDMLQKLCRQLQKERSSYLKQLKENNIEPIITEPEKPDSENNKQGIDIQNQKVNRGHVLTKNLEKVMRDIETTANLSDNEIAQTSANESGDTMVAKCQVSDEKIPAELPEEISQD